MQLISSVAHLGFVVLGIFALTQEAAQGAVIQMVNHGLSTGALFLLVGIIYERTHTREISYYGGIAKIVPFYAFFLLFASLSSIGLPGLNGFVGEFLILLGSFKSPVLDSWWFTVFAASRGYFCSCIFIMDVSKSCIWGSEKSKVEPFERHEQTRNICSNSYLYFYNLDWYLSKYFFESF